MQVVENGWKEEWNVSNPPSKRRCPSLLRNGYQQRWLYIPFKRIIVKTQPIRYRCDFQKQKRCSSALIKPDDSQPYTVIEQYIKTGGLSVQLNADNGYRRPINYNISDYLLLGLLPASHSREAQVEGLKSNGRSITFTNCNGNPRNQLIFYTAENAYRNNTKSCDSTRMDIDWRGTVKSAESSSKMPIYFYMLTEFSFGGCGCYTVSSSWSGRENPANATAIGMR